jgi:LEA14-like dessication related protein
MNNHALFRSVRFPAVRIPAVGFPAAGLPRIRARFARIASLAALVTILSGCASVVRAPAVAILDVRLASLGLSGGAAALVLEIDNPNRFALQMDGLSYRIQVSNGGTSGLWETLAEGRIDQPVRIEGRDSAQVTVEVPFRYSAVGAALGALVQGRGVPYRLEGEVLGRGLGLNRALTFRSEGSLTP